MADFDGRTGRSRLEVKREGKCLTRQNHIVVQFVSTNHSKRISIESMEFESPRVAENEEDFASARLGIEIEFRVGFFTGR